MTDHDPALVDKVVQALIAEGAVPSWVTINGIHSWRCTKGGACVCVRKTARAILDKVAPDLRKQGAVTALRDAAGLIYNGAPDPRQALYNYGGNPWLNELADRIEAGEQP